MDLGREPSEAERHYLADATNRLTTRHLVKAANFAGEGEQQGIDSRWVCG